MTASLYYNYPFCSPDIATQGLFCGFSLFDRIEMNKCIGKNRAKTRKITKVSAIDSKNFDFAGSLCYTDDALKEGLI